MRRRAASVGATGECPGASALGYRHPVAGDSGHASAHAAHPGMAQKSKSVLLLLLTRFPNQFDSSPSEATVCLFLQLNSPRFGKLSTPAHRRLDLC